MSVKKPNAQEQLVKTLNRVSGLVSAVFAISETNASQEIAEPAAYGVYLALKREIDALEDAAETGKIVAVESGEPVA
jgi:hypothetical protein